MDPDQTAWMRRLVWIHAGHKLTMLILSWRGSYVPETYHFEAMRFKFLGQGYNGLPPDRV
jgi:hypothetical protein